MKDIAVVLGDAYPEKVKEHYGNGSAFGAKLSYIYQGEPKGIAQAIGLCEKYVGNEPFIVYLGDNLLKGGIKDYAESFKNLNHDAMILLCEVENPQQFGVAKFNKNGKLTGLVEKPKQPPSNYALTGIYFLKPTIFKMIKQLKPSWRGELEITEAIQLLLENGYNVGYQFVKGWWKDTGAPECMHACMRISDWRTVINNLKKEESIKAQRIPIYHNRKKGISFSYLPIRFLEVRIGLFEENI